MGSFMVHTQEGSILYVHTKFEADSSIRSKVIKGPKIWKLGHVTPATPISGSFIIRKQEGSVLYVCTKFEADNSIRSKVIGGPKISNLGRVTLSHSPFES